MKKNKSYYIPKEDKSYEIYFSKFDHYQEAQRNRALAQVNKWNLAIDIGANIGLWSRDLTNFFDKTICFEPNPDCINFLKKNIINKKAKIYNCALGEKEESKYLYCPEFSGLSSFINMRTYGFKENNKKILDKFPKDTKKILVKINKLDNFKLKEIDFIKLDSQGYGYKILQGAKKTLMNSSPIICIEIDPTFEDSLEDSNSLKYLKSLNYEIIDVINKEHILKKSF